MTVRSYQLETRRAHLIHPRRNPTPLRHLAHPTSRSYTLHRPIMSTAIDRLEAHIYLFVDIANRDLLVLGQVEWMPLLVNGLLSTFMVRHHVVFLAGSLH